jgi:apolipoprotein N-acyltransferase
MTGRLQIALRLGAALLTGVLLAAAFPPSSQPESAWFALVPLLVLCRYLRPAQAFRWGFLAAAIYWLASFTWLLRLAETGTVWALAALGWVALSAYASVYIALFALCASFLFAWRDRGGEDGDWGPRLRGLALMALLPLVWVGFEKLRACLLTGFPWNLLGVSQFRNLAVIQVAAWGGVYAVSAVLLVMNVAIALMVIRLIGFYRGERRKRQIQIELMIGLGVTMLCLVSGRAQLARLRWYPKDTVELRIAAVQPSIRQDKKWIWTSESIAEICESLLTQTRRAALMKPDLVVWPETALPSPLRVDEENKVHTGKTTAATLRETAAMGVTLLAGAMEAGGARDDPEWYNASFLVDSDARVLKRYRKQHLVPFGEYLPLDEHVEWIRRMAPLGFSCHAGDEATVFTMPGMPATFASLICFEDVIPCLARRAVRAGAGFLVNQTNDAWFDPSTASLQHMSHCVFRCVENRISAVRSANTGVTCTIDRRGAIEYIGNDPQTCTPAFKISTVRVRPPDAPPTFYTRFGDWPFATPCAVLALALLGAAYMARRLIPEDVCRVPADGRLDETQGVQCLGQVAFEIKQDAVVSPTEDVGAESRSFLPRLDEARKRAARFRQNWMADMERQFAAQGLAGVAAATFRDPVDDVLPGWFSLAVVFDYDRMDSNYGIQVFHAFFSRVDPDEFWAPAVVHFGDLIRFDSYCALLVRTKSAASLAYVAQRFGADFDAPGLLPTPIRFLCAHRRDGHLIARTFSLPISAQLRPPSVVPSAEAGVGRIIEEAVKNTAWENR